MPTQSISLSVASGTDTFTSVTQVTDAQARSVDETLTAGATNVEVDIVLTRAQIKSLVLSCIGGDLTIKTNSSSAPADTVVMANNGLTVWSTVAGIGTNPFPTADVTKLFLSSTAGTVFKLRAIVTASNG